MLYILGQSASQTTSSSIITQLGVGGIFALLILQLVLKFLKDMKDKKEKRESPQSSPAVMSPQVISDLFGSLKEIERLSKDLHDWHDVRDEDHVFAWYIRKSLSDSIAQLNNAVSDLARSVRKQTDLMRRLNAEEIDDG